ncbi:MAG: radical SAM protein, partial [Nitrospirota bacterium]
WYKFFKCSEIDPTCLPGEVINAERNAGMRRLFVYKLTHYPIQIFTLLRRFLRYMPVRDVIYLLVKPFLGKKRGQTKAEVFSRAVEHRALKDSAAELTQVSDEKLEFVTNEAKAERLRIQQEQERSEVTGRGA